MTAKGVLIVDVEEKHSGALHSILEGTEYTALAVSSLADAVAQLQEETFGALIIDIDRAVLDSGLLKELRSKHPNLCFIGLSSRSFHPELEEVLSRYIDACFTKSAGYEDLLYWLKAVFDPMVYKENHRHDSADETREGS
jgi:DNA-binding response OmpR family regulator